MEVEKHLTSKKRKLGNYHKRSYSTLVLCQAPLYDVEGEVMHITPMHLTATRDQSRDQSRDLSSCLFRLSILTSTSPTSLSHISDVSH